MLRRAFLARGKHVAHRLGVRTSTLASWESGKAEPRTNRLMMLAGLLSVSPTWLLCGRGTAPLQTDDSEVDSLKTSITELRSMISAPSSFSCASPSAAGS